MNSRQVMIERTCNLLWFAHMLITFILIEMGVVYSLATPSNQSYTMLGIGLLSAPLVVITRIYGTNHLHFLEHENSLDVGFEEESLNEREKKINQFALEIENTKGWERQNIRNETKKWIDKNWEDMKKEEKDLAREKFAYLIPNAQRDGNE